eukprot:TRINITY_DN9343_c3_g1_i1.p1 TRINITY_DN9343_c3_g1~~TRINITY_DN9343_c3_g1_i1.p1  ORF type:complete len:390 (+),score=135.30 TRINITY_DN9343_c3_g1_i1:80-1249(+)
MKSGAGRALARQVRRESTGLAGGLRTAAADRTGTPLAPFVGRTSWSRKYDSLQEERHTHSTQSDEKVEALFGVDHHPWVHPVKDTRLDGRQDAHRRALWELPLYTQSADLRNDLTHIWAQRVPQTVAMTDPMKQFANEKRAANVYYGMYPESFAENPGQFWKDMASKSVYNHMLQEQEQAREQERYGGDKALPTDDYQTHNGVAPFLSSEVYNELKYGHHNSVVRALNAFGDSRDVATILQTTSDDELRALAAEHLSLTVFWRSIRPRGGPLREEYAEVVEESFGSPSIFGNQLVSAASSAEEGATVWVMCDSTTGKLEIVVINKGESPTSNVHKTPITALVILEKYWSQSFDSVKEYAERYLQAYDWDYAAAAHAAAVGNPRPEPLVF